jgi:methyl-accepting chemotaxis protein
MHQFLRHLRLSHKFMLLGGVALLVALPPLFRSVTMSEHEIATARAEVAGIEPSRAALRVMQLTQQHRGLSAAALGGQVEAEAQRAARQADIEQAMTVFDAIVRDRVDNARVRSDWARIRQDWAALVRDVSTRQVDLAQSFARHTALISSQYDLHSRLITVFRLELDPQEASHSLIQATMKQIPRLTESLGQARAKGAAALARREATPAQRAELVALASGAALGLNDLAFTMDMAFEADPALKGHLGDLLVRARTDVETARALVRTQLLDAEALTHAPSDYFKTMTAAIDSVFALYTASGEVLEQDLTGRLQASRRLELAMLGGCLLLMLIGMSVGVGVARSVVRSAHEARSVATRIATGDLSGSVEVRSSDDLGEMMAALRDMQASLIRVVGAVRQNAQGVATASTEIAQGNLDLSTRTEQQASALQETAATMEQLSTTVSHNADSARQANDLAGSASTLAERGGTMVAQVVDKMNGISDASRRIVEIIGVIDGIAFQTNLLALNAAVEAARAGEQGRGFAVVAGEVRTLAQRSAQAAREIKGLIGTSVARVDEGVHVARETGQTVEEVVTSIRRVSEIVGQISAASAEQNVGVKQIGQAIAQMDQVTQQNAALVEQSAAAATGLRQQAQDLVGTVAVFRLDGGSAPLATSSRAASPAQVRRDRAPASASVSANDDWTSF